MNLSTRGRYGTRAMVELAIGGSKQPMQVEAIAKRQEIPVSYLAQLLHTLRRAGLVKSVRGAHGGYILARSPSRISIMEILHVLEGTLTPARCVDDPACCGRVKRCPTRGLWTRLKRAIVRTLDETTLDDLAREQTRRRETSAAMYYI